MTNEQIIRENIAYLKNEQIREKIASLKKEQINLIHELDELVESGKNQDVKGLRKEADLRENIEDLQTRIDKLEDMLEDKLEDKEKGLTTGKKLALTLGIIGLCGILGAFIGKSINKNCASKETITVDKSISASMPNVTVQSIVVETATEEPTPAATEEPTPAPTAEPTPAPTAEPTPVLSEDEIIEMDAEAVYSEHIMPMLDELNNPALEAFVTIESVEDMVRMVNGKLPIYDEYDDSKIVETVNLMNDIFANQGNENKVYPVRYSKLFPADSKEAKFIKSYEDIYDEIDAYRAEANGDGVVEQVGHLGTKIYNEWGLAGLYGGWNPYLFPAEERYMLLQMCVAPSSNHINEWLKSNDLTVCFESCVKLNENGEVSFDENGEVEHELVSFQDLIEALYMGKSINGKFAIYKDDKVVSLFAETYADAQEYFNEKANAKVRKSN